VANTARPKNGGHATRTPLAAGDERGGPGRRAVRQSRGTCLGGLAAARLRQIEASAARVVIAICFSFDAFLALRHEDRARH